MNISIGSPPFQITRTLDSNVVFTWTQCDGCFGFAGPVFDPSRSSTYQDISCSLSESKSLPNAKCDHTSGKICQYGETHTGGTFTGGNAARDTVSLMSTSGKLISFPKIIIGCGHKNGSPCNHSTSGIIMLGPDRISLLSQMGQVVANKFSYSMVPQFIPKKPSKLHFGDSATVKGPGVVSTPLARDPDMYFLTLEGISLGQKI
ncbi:hypothetical protein CDL15_Pgr021380 [Punica granatum]|uniref:Peptidase A1 domain-containing protein n=1 Tax=Punica granatum TaxID=22663 RepID=A0A218WR92_PUNGR|nr:hypothetical protein CDL15_Pgr021380 [Punica granatum]